MTEEEIQPGSIDVRLTTQERQQILAAVRRCCMALAMDWSTISLFGSRVNLAKRGGDIDLYIRLLPQSKTDRDRFRSELSIALEELLGEQKIDIVVDDGQGDLGAIAAIIQQQKVDLWTKSLPKK